LKLDEHLPIKGSMTRIKNNRLEDQIYSKALDAISNWKICII